MLVGAKRIGASATKLNLNATGNVMLVCPVRIKIKLLKCYRSLVQTLQFYSDKKALHFYSFYSVYNKLFYRHHGNLQLYTV